MSIFCAVGRIFLAQCVVQLNQHPFLNAWWFDPLMRSSMKYKSIKSPSVNSEVYPGPLAQEDALLKGPFFEVFWGFGCIHTWTLKQYVNLRPIRIRAQLNEHKFQLDWGFCYSSILSIRAFFAPCGSISPIFSRTSRCALWMFLVHSCIAGSDWTFCHGITKQPRG